MRIVIKLIVVLIVFPVLFGVISRKLFGGVSGFHRTAEIYTTSKDGQRFATGKPVAFEFLPQALESEISVFVNPGMRFQKMVGIGAAITDASAEAFAKVNAETQDKLLTDFFDVNKGLGYSLLRTSIHSCDFSSGSYTYIKEGDKELSSFSIGHDLKYRVPLLKRILHKVNTDLPLFVSPWSPPAFMKDNHNMLKGGKLLPEYYQSWANYYIKFIQAYEKEGIPIWGLTVQNEPMAIQKWESCIYTAEEERDFLKNFLGPALNRAGMLDKKVIVWDHNRDLIFQRADVILKDTMAARYVWGIGYHWYETWSGGEQMHDNLTLVHEAFPDKNLIFTEGCAESFDSTRYSDWSFGEFYARAMIRDFNKGVTGWTDWNIFLDEKGGPNHVGNFCFAPVHIDTRNSQIIYTSSYYYLGHFSKFIRPGASRIACSSSRSILKSTAFVNTDGKVCVIIMNDSDKDTDYTVRIGNEGVKLHSEPHSIQTVLF